MPNAALALLDPAGGRPHISDPSLPVLRADDLGVLRGEAVFETARVAAGRPAFLPAHLLRLARSAARLAIDLPGGWEELAAAAVAEYAAPEGVLRLVCSKGPPGGVPVGFALVSPIPAETTAGRERGVSVITLALGITADIRADSPWLLGGVKSTSYAVNMATLRQAHDEGADDAIWVSADGEVLESPTATVAWIRRGGLSTPPADAVGVLPGTTLDVVLELCRQRGIATEVRRGTVDELQAADEVLLLSSVRGVAPVIKVNDRTLAIGPVTAGLRAGFEAALLA